MEKSVPQHRRLSSLGKPRDAKQRSSGQIFLSYPHTHDRFLCVSGAKLAHESVERFKYTTSEMV